MIKPLISIIIFLLSIITFGQSNKRTVHVKSHINKSGTVVPAHERTHPNKTQKNNWSSEGNINPYTGKKGYKTPKK